MKKIALLLIVTCSGLFGCAVYERPYHNDDRYGGGHEVRGDHDHDYGHDRDHGGDWDHRGPGDRPEQGRDWR